MRGDPRGFLAFSAWSEGEQPKGTQHFHCRQATFPCANALAKLFTDLRAAAQRRRGRAVPEEIKFSCEDRKLTAGKHCPPHVSEDSSSRFTYFCYHLLLMHPKSEAWGQLLCMGDSYQKDKTQQSVLLNPGPCSSSAKHRSALEPHFIYLYTLLHSLFLATGAHDIVAWDMLEQGSGSPCKWWQQLPPGSRVY